MQAIQQQVEELSEIAYEKCLLETMTALVQKAPQSTLALKLPALVKLLAVTLKQCRLFMLVPEKFEHLCLTAAALMEVFITSWYQHSCSIEGAFVHLKPLLPDMMYLLHMKKGSSSEEVQKLHKSIKRFVHTSLFLRNNVAEWLTALYEYLRLDGFNAHVPLKKVDPNCEEVMEAGDDEMEEGDVKVNQKMIAVLQAEPHRRAEVKKGEGFLLEKLMEFFAEVWKGADSPKKPAADFLPEFFSVFLEGLISYNKYVLTVVFFYVWLTVSTKVDSNGSARGYFCKCSHHTATFMWWTRRVRSPVCGTPLWKLPSSVHTEVFC